MRKSILAIDPGTRCGWALAHDGKVIVSGTWNLKENRFAGAGMRFLRLEALLNELAQSVIPQLVVFEEVRRHMGVDAAHIYGGIVGMLTAWCERRKIPYQGIPVQHIKKFATQKGNAKKDAMIAAANAKWPEAQITDDNEADARWIAAFADTLYGE